MPGLNLKLSLMPLAKVRYVLVPYERRGSTLCLRQVRLHSLPFHPYRPSHRLTFALVVTTGVAAKAALFTPVK